MALNDLDTLIRRFPDSHYARDAAIKRDLTLDHLAGKEMEVGRYYLNRLNFKRRHQPLSRRDPRLPDHHPRAEALERLVESYMTLGLKDAGDQGRRRARLQLSRQQVVSARLPPDGPRAAPEADVGPRRDGPHIDTLFKPD